MDNNTKYDNLSKEELQKELQKEENLIDDKRTRLQDLKDALSLHLEQIQRLGYNLEDCICEILRKDIEKEEAYIRRASIKSALRSIKIKEEYFS